MKKIVIASLLLIAVLHNNYAQTVQFSIGVGSTANSMRIYMRPTISANPATFSTLQFNVSIPNTITPVPTLSLVSQAFTGVAWIIAPAYNEDGYWNYNIYTTAAGYSLNVTAGVEFTALELAFTGGPPGSFLNAAHVTCLGLGGTVTGNGYTFCSGTLDSNSSGSGLFYDRDGPGPEVVVLNVDSYNIGGPAGLSYARYTPGLILPVTFLSYDVTCNDKGALITWSTLSEQNSDKFEIQRSINGTDWKTVGTVSAAGNSNDARNYQFIDISGGGTAQYRVRQVDIDGKFVYTAIKMTNCRTPQFDVLLYPVPANDKLNVVVKSDNDINTELRIVDMSGRVVKQIYTQIFKGSTNITIPVHNLPNGQYVLVSAEPAMNISSKFVVAH